MDSLWEFELVFCKSCNGQVIRKSNSLQQLTLEKLSRIHGLNCYAKDLASNPQSCCIILFINQHFYHQSEIIILLRTKQSHLHLRIRIYKWILVMIDQTMPNTQLKCSVYLDSENFSPLEIPEIPNLENHRFKVRTCGCFLKWWYPQNTPK